MTADIITLITGPGGFKHNRLKAQLQRYVFDGISKGQLQALSSLTSQLFVHVENQKINIMDVYCTLENDEQRSEVGGLMEAIEHLEMTVDMIMDLVAESAVLLHKNEDN